MKKYIFKISLIFCFGLLILSCETDKKSTVVLDQTTENASDFIIEQDTTLIKVLKLPVYIDSTKYLYHPIALERIYENEEFTLRKSSYASYSKTSNYNNYTFTGKYAGFIVEDIQNGNKINVIKHEVNISNVRIYNKLQFNPRVEFVLYEGHDLDTNKDQQLNHKDLTALFISNLDGTNFKKLTEDFEELNGRRFIVENDKLYFQTQKDANRNGTFDSSDGYRNYMVDLNDPLKKVIRYDEEFIKKYH